VDLATAVQSPYFSLRTSVSALLHRLFHRDDIVGAGAPPLFELLGCHSQDSTSFLGPGFSQQVRSIDPNVPGRVFDTGLERAARNGPLRRLAATGRCQPLN
jgi:hypothetical protein